MPIRECWPDDPLDPADDYGCPVCGGCMEWVSCWQCHGQGGWHDCGEDCCPCLDKDEITEDCDECDGEGRYLVCGSLPHTEEQMERYRAGKGGVA